MKIDVGQVWLCRNEKTKVTIEEGNSVEFPWSGECSDGGLRRFTGRGHHIGNHVNDEFDLVKLISHIDLTEQTIETFAKIVRNGGKTPDGFERQALVGDDWRWLASNAGFFIGMNYRLAPIEPPSPEMVPLSADDIPPGSVVRLAEGGWLNIAEVTDDGITVNSLAPDRISYADLKGDEWQILRPGQTWQRCEKAAT